MENDSDVSGDASGLLQKMSATTARNDRRHEPLARGSRTPDSSHSRSSHISSSRSSSRASSTKPSRVHNKLALLVKEGRKNVLYPKTIQRIFKAMAGIPIVKLHERLLGNNLCFSEMEEEIRVEGYTAVVESVVSVKSVGKEGTEKEKEGETKQQRTTESRNSVPKTLNKLQFGALFRDIMTLTTSRHGR